MGRGVGVGRIAVVGVETAVLVGEAGSGAMGEGVQALPAVSRMRVNRIVFVMFFMVISVTQGQKEWKKAGWREKPGSVKI